MKIRDEALSNLKRYMKVFPLEAAGLQRLYEQLHDDQDDIFCRKNMRGHITTSALVIDVATLRVLLIDHQLLKRWLQPGGHYEGPGSLLDSAIRETGEETGVSDVHLHPWHDAAECAFDIDTHDIGVNPKKGEGEHLHHDYIFLTVVNSAQALVPQTAEVFDAKWEPVGILNALPGARFKRIAKKLVAQGIVPLAAMPGLI
jgi:8-oxo-dGTP pyrophosphatase MutT (NUDIX family)